MWGKALSESFIICLFSNFFFFLLKEKKKKLASFLQVCMYNTDIKNFLSAPKRNGNCLINFTFTPFKKPAQNIQNRKKMAQEPTTTKSDDIRLTRSMTQKGDGARSTTVVFTVRGKPASSAVSGYDLISKAPSSSLRTMMSSSGTFATKSSSSKKKTVS